MMEQGYAYDRGRAGPARPPGTSAYSTRPIRNGWRVTRTQAASGQRAHYSALVKGLQAPTGHFLAAHAISLGLRRRRGRAAMCRRPPLKLPFVAHESAQKRGLAASAASACSSVPHIRAAWLYAPARRPRSGVEKKTLSCVSCRYATTSDTSFLCTSYVMWKR
jgi:hypothetical protein